MYFECASYTRTYTCKLKWLEEFIPSALHIKDLGELDQYTYSWAAGRTTAESV
jgi:hypothetical protein